MTNHSRFLKEAINAACENLESGGGPFGAIVVKDGSIVGRGGNVVTKDNDPTAHAEVTAIRDACKNLGTFQLDGCIIYSSCEPCPMCLGAIYWARPTHVYYAMNKDDAAKIGFDDAFIYDEIAKVENERLIPFVRLDLNDQRPFEQWKSKIDKVEY
ncbi:nucleoside deaminase [Geomicrobium sp. JCM 19038]|uniref:nucleoside deaminase n=1 Tax=Geomicrobium sp. JCM 19038 TaxID=1460635 RepID=UPI00045F23FA|nr:nucleoside deaminase [Geomicrobium sp. JCM 19038]GAK06988.1 guanine deaminase [Geomicrobium sp. JCM 19038]